MYLTPNDSFYRPPNAATNHLFLGVPAYVADMRLSGAITTSPSTPVAGQTFTVSYTVRNHGSQPAIFQGGVLQCRRSGINCDPTYESPITINAGNSHTFTSTFNNPPSGNYTFTPYFVQNDTFYRYDKGVVASNFLQINI